MARATPFHWTTDELMKLLPDATMVRAAAPAALVFGLMLLKVGAGFCVPPEEVAGLPLPPHPTARTRNSKRLSLLTSILDAWRDSGCDVFMFAVFPIVQQQ